MYFTLGESDYKKTWSYSICLSHRGKREERYRVPGTTTGPLPKWIHCSAVPGQMNSITCHFTEREERPQQVKLISQDSKAIEGDCLLFTLGIPLSFIVPLVLSFGIYFGTLCFLDELSSSLTSTLISDIFYFK